jgi:hypothetical protein
MMPRDEFLRQFTNRIKPGETLGAFIEVLVAIRSGEYRRLRSEVMLDSGGNVDIPPTRAALLLHASEFWDEHCGGGVTRDEAEHG